MQHTLVAVFDNRTDAQNAMNELMSSGFSRDEVKLSNADPTGMTDSVTGQPSTSHDSSSDTLADGTGLGIGASIKHFFTDLFGADNSPHVSKYEGAVTRGHHVLTVRADSLPEVERAADIVERYGPTDIDEQASGAGADMGTLGASGGLSESMRMSGAGGMQQSSQMSAQSDTGSSQGGMTATGAAISSTGVGASMGAGSGPNAIQQLDNPGDRKLFQQQSLNQAEPMGTTYQEPQGKSGLTATGGTSLQASTLQENSVQASALEGTQSDRSLHSSGIQGGTLQGSSLDGSAMQGTSGSMQRDTAMGSGSTGYNETQRGKSRIYSRSQDAGTGGGSGLAIGSNFFGDDDDAYRNHFLANYSGDDYDRVKPAYAYGSEMARSDKYRGRKWDEVENDLRSDWSTRNGGSAAGDTWDRMKAAVQRGWDRMTMDRDDDTYYRSHYDTNLSNSGMDYDSVKPAYSYGSEMRKSEMYRNRPWDDIEGDLARGWDSRVTGTTGTTGMSTSSTTGTGAGAAVSGAWDKMKTAVRHGWDRMTDDEDDDREYRSHWNATYSTATGAGSYDDYKPAYSYGSEMARNEKYRGRQWGEVENDLRTDWDSRYGSGDQSTWEKMKSAVRHGWDRMTS
ncbi:hypothetical protein [Massilia sp. IC2-476]|uniref:hypothetical protein n=1 Tax=Massilia sp. IC2-476 TaxID=2887199 RepID=UPI001D116FCA|nr:hypothetical protein [Massilia sp. IC2-476]MCC2974342.1 hypothetical protein [Massilia sp. IC2-476]